MTAEQAETAKTTAPILYSFRRCPYAMRARIALVYAGISCEIREIHLREKPQHMLEVSPKGTVPVLLQPDGHVLEESMDIVHWALEGQDTVHHGTDVERKIIAALIDHNDTVFVPLNHRYKYATRYPDEAMEDNRAQAEIFLKTLEEQLIQHKYLYANIPSQADIAIFPFIRQFSMVDEKWFYNRPYPQLQRWLDDFKASDVFATAMTKYDRWSGADAAPVFFNRKD